MTKRRPNWVVRTRLLLAALVVGHLLVVARAVDLQWLDGERWAARAAHQHRQQDPLPAPRGVIYDRNGVPLAANREVLRVAVAPRELESPGEVARRLRDALSLSESEARRAVDPGRRWVVLPGRFDVVVRDRLAGVAGIYFESVLERIYPQGELALEILGRVAADGAPLGGLELELDTLIRGRSGTQVFRRDGRGEPIPGAMLTVVEPVPGHDIHLTIDAGLQEIVQGALGRAVEETGAAGGDLLLLDPRTGEILAAVTHRSSGMRHWRAVTEPYEPGSTLKPFFIAALLAGGHAALADSVYAERGSYRTGQRTISDVQPHEWLTVRDALRVSSNIAMVKLSERLSPAEYYNVLRDFGFGAPTGVPYPSEAAGVLRRPAQWSAYSRGSLAIGYEISTTPLQMALAYGALANDGTLMEPRLIREIRARDGTVLAGYPPRPVRRSIPAAVARELATALAEVVEAGTGREAGLGPFRVAGKTGTARLLNAGRYERAYTASFAGFFPVTDPQLVFVVKLDRPRGPYYGSVAAAPVTRATLSAALAARSSPLDRAAMAKPAVAAGPAGGSDGAASDRAGPPVPRRDAGPRVVVDLGPASPAGAAGTQGPDMAAVRAVPDVAGLSLRDAARVLHGRGFRVRVEGNGEAARTVPAAGAAAEAGAVVVIHARGSSS